MTKLLLINLPWPRLEHLSIQTATLSGFLEATNHVVVQCNYAACIRSYIGEYAYNQVVSNDLQQYEAAAMLFTQYGCRYRELFASTLSSEFDFTQYIENCETYFYEVAEDIESHQAELVGFTTSFLQFLPSVYVARLIKSRPNVKVVLGGAVLSTDYSRRAMEHFPWIDYIVYGEGERTLLELCDNLEKPTVAWSDIRGLVLRDSEGVRVKRSTTPNGLFG